VRAIVIHRHGGPEVLTYEPNWPDPVAGPGEMVVRVRACALNPLDIFTREGMPGEPTPLPHITGGDVAGVVASVGPGVESPRVGDRVVLNPSWGCGVCEYCRDGDVPKCLRVHMLGEMDPGGLAELVKCPARQAIRFRAPPEEPRLPITRHRLACRTHARVQPAGRPVHGAVGGVGPRRSRSPSSPGARPRHRLLDREAGARRNSGAASRSTTPGQGGTRRCRRPGSGVDVIVETVGAATWERSIRALGKGGRLVTSGATSGPIGQTDIRYLFRREHTIQGSNGWTHNDLLTITRLAFAGRLRPLIDRVLPLEQAADGERAMERREVIGKVVIRP
jgi:NADPH:quinone reductase-like Zn-dependent oxidoreductase